MNAATTVGVNFSLKTDSLVVSKSGSGDGQLTSDPPGLDCAPGCEVAFGDFVHGPVNLVATPDAWSEFAGWSDPSCGASPTCQVTIPDTATLTATFSTKKALLETRTEGTGACTVTSVPPGIDCGQKCAFLFDHGTPVELSVSPANDPPSRFVRWGAGSGCGGSPVCNLDVNQDTALVAHCEIEDRELPTVDVLAPDGSEFWVLTDDETNPNREIAAWSMADDVWICGVDVSLLCSEDGGATFRSAPAAGGLPASFSAPGGRSQCSAPGLTTSSLEVTVPTEPPCIPGALYKLQVEATDFAGKTTAETSRHPFFIVRRGPERKTLILTHLDRFRTHKGSSPARLDELERKLMELAAHRSVAGQVLDLGTVASLAPLYAAWDANPTDPLLANEVLFAPGGGVHALIRDLIQNTFTGVQYIVVIGDGLILPQARIEDRAVLFLESKYTLTDPTDPDFQQSGLPPDTTRVGFALDADYFLSDDPIAVTDEVEPADLLREGTFFLPDLAVGRLVESPEEIISSIATFLATDGVLNLRQLDAKALVTGYDFLIDAAARIDTRLRGLFGPGAVDGALISEDWDRSTVPQRRDALHSALSTSPGLISLNGHATHFEEGVPGATFEDIQGLGTIDLTGGDACGSTSTRGAVGLVGSVVLSTGCHGGLMVPGSCFSDAEHSLDLPQAMLSQGVQAYIAPTGYSWALFEGVGYSERLAEILASGLTASDTVVVGQALKAAKELFMVENPRFDAFDLKSSMELALYGFPMYSVVTGLDAGAKRSGSGGVIVTRLEPTDLPLPDFLTRATTSFDLTAEGVYEKVDASGAPVTQPGCPDARGCYYTLNGQAIGEIGLLIEPLFVHDSRLSGTSQHGVMWTGGSFQEEENWLPVIARPVANGGLSRDDLGPLPQTVMSPATGPVQPCVMGGSRPDCRTADLGLNTVIVTTGAAVHDPVSDTWKHQLFRKIDLEVFYLNDRRDPLANCDRAGPSFNSGVHHSTSGRTIHWQVEVSDADHQSELQAGVWRVVVVFDDGVRDASGLGQWRPLELAWDAASERWLGELTILDSDRVTYFLQAVDFRGNIGWLEFEPAIPPPSGVSPGIPKPVEVVIQQGTADLDVEMAAVPSPVEAGAAFQTIVEVINLDAAEPADLVTVTLELPPEVSRSIFAPDWACSEPVSGTWICQRDRLEPGATSKIELGLTAPQVPPASGTLPVTARIEAANDPNESNNSAVLQIEVIASSETDLTVTQNGPEEARAGEEVAYTILVSNRGPNTALGARVRTLPQPGLLEMAWTCTAPPGSSCATSGVGPIDERVDLDIGQSLSFNLTARLAVHLTGAVGHTATVAVPPGMGELNPGDESSTVTTQVLPVQTTDLEVTLEADRDTVKVAQPIHLSLLVTNLSDSVAATAVTLTLDVSASRIEGSPTAPGWDCFELAGTLTCERSSLEAGLTSKIELEVTAPQVEGVSRTTAWVQAANDSNPLNDQATVDVTVIDPNELPLPAMIFGDGFETGDLSAWTAWVEPAATAEGSQDR